MLCKTAGNAGIEIDNVYRIVNGIAFQIFVDFIA